MQERVGSERRGRKDERELQLPRESVINYWTNVDFLCAWFDNNMSEQKLCGYILKDLNTSLLQYIPILDHSNFVEFRREYINL